jgi:Fe-S cluster biosynthesis and repair protein YggX
MKHNRQFQDQIQNQAKAPRPTAAAALNSEEVDFAPAPDEVARRAYFSYVNQGSLDGHEVQHWLAAEAELIAERRLTRMHAFQHRA